MQEQEPPKKYLALTGYTEGVDHHICLEQVCIVASPHALRRLADFLNECADGMEKYPDFCHLHFRDFLNWEDSGPDVIVAAPADMHPQ